MKFVVTGGAGFIGSHVVDGLVQAGYDVLIVDNLSTGRDQNLNGQAVFIGPNDVSEVPGDWLDAETVVIHLAAQPKCSLSVYAPSDDVICNYLPGVTFMTKCIQRRIRRFVLMSSIAVYGDINPLPYTEDMFPQPRDPYAINKHALEQLCLTECRRNGIDAVVMRAQHVFGPRQRPDFAYRNVIARWIWRALNNQPLPVFGSLDIRRAFSPVSLVSRGVIRAALQEDVADEVFNLGSAVVRSLGDLSQEIANLLRVSVIHDIRPPPSGLLRESYGAVTKAQERLGIVEEPGEFDRNLSELVWDIMQWGDVEEVGMAPDLRTHEYKIIYGGGAYG